MPPRINTSANNISNIPETQPVFEGDSNVGPKFAGQGQGWSFKQGKTCQYVNQGSASTLAAGLTECCITLGRGKVFYLIKGTDSSAVLTGKWTEQNSQLPSLLYIDYVWDAESVREWYNTEHWARFALLNARANAMSSEIVVMPVNLHFELDNYQNIVFSDSLAIIAMYHNRLASTYLGFTEPMARNMGYMRKKGATRGKWFAPKQNVRQFRMRTGQEVVSRLQQMYQEGRQGSLWFFEEIMKKVIAAHNEWVAAGGYTMAGDTCIGADLARRFEDKVQALTVLTQAADRPQPMDQNEAAGRAQPGDRLQELRSIFAQWNEDDRETLQGYIDTANTGLFAMAIYMVEDDSWLALPLQQKRLAVEYYQLNWEHEMRMEMEEMQQEEQINEGAEDNTIENALSQSQYNNDL